MGGRGGLPFEFAEIGIGHKLQGVAGRYVNLSDDHIRTAFQEMFQKLATAQEFVTKLYREKSDVAW